MSLQNDQELRENLEVALKGLKTCKKLLNEIINAPSIASARVIAKVVVGEIDTILNKIEHPVKAIERLAFAKERGHDFNRTDVEVALNLAKKFIDLTKPE